MTARNVALPFLTIPDDLVKRTPWFRIEGEDRVEELGTEVPGWDYDTELTVTRNIELDVERCLAETGLENSSASLGVLVTLQTAQQGYRWVGINQEIERTGRHWSDELKLSIRGEMLAHDLRLVTDIILYNTPASAKPLAAARRGSRLWNDVHAVALEGKSSRFPMEFISFSKALSFLGAPYARWYLHWSPERLEASFIGNIVLFINSDDPDYSNRVVTRDPAIIEWLRFGVIRQICAVLIDDDHFTDHAGEFAEGSLGAMARGWLELAFDGMPVNTVKTIFKQDRSRFEAVLQSVFGAYSV